MAGTPTTYKGNNAVITITAGGGDLTHSALAISDFSLTLDKGTVEQELVGENGNYFLAGSMSADGSLTACRLGNGALGDIVSDMINGNAVTISGTCGTNSLHFYFVSAMITGFDFSVGDADTISEGSVDFTLLEPYKVSSVSVVNGYTRISDGH